MRILSSLISLIFLLNLFFVPQYTAAQELSKRKVKVFVKKGRKAYRKEEYWKSKSYYDKVTDANTDKAQY